jgi:signal transduction histidine kinase
VRLAQVFANLLNNAAKYSDEGGRIWLKAGRVGEEALVSVRDEGAGIEADMLPRVFDLFAQANGVSHHGRGG